jgi:hypothetical protein
LRLFEAFVPETKCFGAYRIVRFGVQLGYFFKSRTAYDHEIIVMPNFGSTLYGKVALLNAKIKENDSLFYKK